MRFGGGVAANVMSPSMIDSMADFSIFDEAGRCTLLRPIYLLNSVDP
jgi:hypothetical protein